MVSFQKNGKVLDGFGTKPDIKIERDINQILWKSDYQLEPLRALILNRLQKLLDHLHKVTPHDNYNLPTLAFTLPYSFQKNSVSSF